MKCKVKNAQMNSRISASELKKYVVVAHVDYLYHSTCVRNAKSKEYFDELVESQITAEYIEEQKRTGKYDWQCRERIYEPLPKEGEFSTRLDIEKYFTVTNKCCYTFFQEDWVFLRYPTLKPLRLFDVRAYVEDHLVNMKWVDMWKERCAFRNSLWKRAAELDMDGFFDLEDCVEVCLFNAIDCVGNFYTILPHPPHDHPVNHAPELAALHLSKF